MKLKKNPKADLRRRGLLFFQIGMILMLFLAWQAIEWKSHDSASNSSAQLAIGEDWIEEIPITETKIKELPKKQVVTQEIEVFKDDDDIIEEDILPTDVDQDLDIVDVDDIVEDTYEEPEEVIFTLVEVVPVFPGCENAGNNEARKACMSEKIRKFVQKKFDTDMAGDLGLEGKQRITCVFKINQFGEVVDIKARAPHPKLEQEAKEVVGGLPKMTPGKQRGKPVIVSYSLPILFQVEN